MYKMQSLTPRSLESGEGDRYKKRYTFQPNLGSAMKEAGIGEGHLSLLMVQGRLPKGYISWTLVDDLEANIKIN